MKREVDLVSYLPPFMQKYREPVAALEAEKPEFDLIWDSMDRIFYNRFISTADEYGISRFERMMELFLQMRRLWKRAGSVSIADGLIPYHIQ